MTKNTKTDFRQHQLFDEAHRRALARVAKRLNLRWTSAVFSQLFGGLGTDRDTLNNAAARSPRQVSTRWSLI